MGLQAVAISTVSHTPVEKLQEPAREIVRLDQSGAWDGLWQNAAQNALTTCFAKRPNQAAVSREGDQLRQAVSTPKMEDMVATSEASTAVSSATESVILDDADSISAEFVDEKFNEQQSDGVQPLLCESILRPKYTSC